MELYDGLGLCGAYSPIDYRCTYLSSLQSPVISITFSHSQLGQSFPTTSDRPDMSGETEVYMSEYPVTFDLQSGYFLVSSVFRSCFWSHKVRIGHWPPTFRWNFFWSDKSFKFTGPTVQWNFDLIGKDCRPACSHLHLLLSDCWAICFNKKQCALFPKMSLSEVNI